MSRVFNFSAGPAVLPAEVLQQAQAEMLDYEGSGMSVMEMSHRGKEFIAIQAEAEANLRKLLGVPDDYAVLFLQGCATAQFAMIPMNLLGAGQSADYTNSGAWAKKAIGEAKCVGQVNVIADCSKDRPTRVPRESELSYTDGAAYVHVTSNETISGAQWPSFPKTAAPLIADMSSDILSRPLDVSQFGLIYAGAQKNLGPSGVTVVIIRKDLAEQAPDSVPAIFRYATHIEAESMYNTPPCYSIYLVMLVTRWLLERGGVPAMAERNAEKAKKLYDALDASSFYSPSAAVEHRSTMNVTFRLPSEELEETFAKEADKAGFKQLKGHRSVGGIRASIYNAFPPEGVDALVEFMSAFEKHHG